MRALLLVAAVCALMPIAAAEDYLAKVEPGTFEPPEDRGPAYDCSGGVPTGPVGSVGFLLAQIDSTPDPLTSFFVSGMTPDCILADATVGDCNTPTPACVHVRGSYQLSTGRYYGLLEIHTIPIGPIGPIGPLPPLPGVKCTFQAAMCVRAATQVRDNGSDAVYLSGAPLPGPLGQATVSSPPPSFPPDFEYEVGGSSGVIYIDNCDSCPPPWIDNLPP